MATLEPTTLVTMTEEFKTYVREILDFNHMDGLGVQSYSERLGVPDELSSSIGLICTAFQTLDEEVSIAIAKMIGEPREIGAILTAELSFKNKVHAFVSLVKQQSPTRRFNWIPGHEKEHLDELGKALFKAEELRNQVVHSMIVKPVTGIHAKQRIVRIKRTAKARLGLKERQEDVSIAHLLNIYDWTISLAMEVDMFCIDLESEP